MKENEWTLLASAPNEDKLKQLIARYWCTSSEEICFHDSGYVIFVANSGKLIQNFRVIRNGKRYRFEGRHNKMVTY